MRSREANLCSTKYPHAVKVTEYLRLDQTVAQHNKSGMCAGGVAVLPDGIAEVGNISCTCQENKTRKTIN